MNNKEHDKKAKKVKKDIQSNIERLENKISKANAELDYVYYAFLYGKRSQFDKLQECGLTMHKLVEHKTELEKLKKKL